MGTEFKAMTFFFAIDLHRRLVLFTACYVVLATSFC